MKTLHLACVVGARPNFMKMAPLMRAIDATEGLEATLIHTGQHYDAALSDIFFEQLDMRRPDFSLDVGSGSQAVQTARILERIEPVLEAGPVNVAELAESSVHDDQRSEVSATSATEGSRFDALIVVGDVNSTMAAAIAAAKLGIAVVHVEAGLRSFDRTMPEEINRIVTDSISDLLLVSDPAGVDHLRREGHADEKIHLVGNLMIDTLMHSLQKAKQTSVLEELALESGKYGVVTLHRPSNVDDAATLGAIIEVLAEISERLPLVFPIHPRTKARLEEFGLMDRLKKKAPQILALPPKGYLEFLALVASAKVVVTDSGGLQEETTVLSIPCLTMRANTERPITVEQGSSTLIGNDADKLKEQLETVLAGVYDVGTAPVEWDGKAAQRVITALETLRG